MSEKKSKTTVITEKSLSVQHLKQIMDNHSLPYFMYEGELYGVIPYLYVDTLIEGFSITNITNFSQEQMRDYLSY